MAIQEGSFQKAAEKLFISQPSISASVRRVEERIGSQIFDRSMKPLGLTECGRQYIRCETKTMFSVRKKFCLHISDSCSTIQPVDILLCAGLR